MFTDITCWPVKDNQVVKARGRFVYNEIFSINYTLMNGSDGLWVSMPGKWGQDKEGKRKWYSDVYCNNDEVKEELKTLVVNKYKETLNNEKGENTGSGFDDEIPF